MTPHQRFLINNINISQISYQDNGGFLTYNAAQPVCSSPGSFCWTRNDVETLEKLEKLGMTGVSYVAFCCHHLSASVGGNAQ